MKTQVRFSSKLFPERPGESEEINPGIFGKALAEFLRVRLEVSGFKVKEFVTEDWGLLLVLENANFPLWVACANEYGQTERFLCFIEPYNPRIWRWFRSVDTTVEVGALQNALAEIFRLEKGIGEVVWQVATRR